jgi:hypothetical protein
MGPHEPEVRGAAAVPAGGLSTLQPYGARTSSRVDTQVATG